jgi:ABC-2 type transport system ATP-binding protein
VKTAVKHVQYIGYLPEERGLYNSMKGRAMFVFGTNERLQKPRKKTIRILEKLEIQGWWNKKIQELSKGMAQNSVRGLCCINQNC